jgi:glycosyltransferase involved in cell wall biosynthesis
MSDRPGPRVVVVHDWLTGMRGGEKVLESILRVVPDAELITLVHRRGSVSPLIEGRRIRTSVVDRLPAAARRYREYLPVFPIAIEGFDLDDADVVISTSHCAAKAVVSPGRATHVCYCHSPMRYAWDQFDAYFGEARVGAARSRALRPVLAWLARWDRATAGRVDHFIANSAFVAGRISRYYNRRASVLHPPVDTRFFTPDGRDPDAHFLVVSALVPYKRIDIALAAARDAGVPLRIVGDGPDAPRLRALAGPRVEWLGTLDAEALRDEYRRASAVVLPAEEDFGIVPLEAMACGRPTIALGRGGACETVRPGVTGILVEEQTPAAFADALRAFDRGAFDPAALREAASAFSTERFETAFASTLSGILADRC